MGKSNRRRKIRKKRAKAVTEQRERHKDKFLWDPIPLLDGKDQPIFNRGDIDFFGPYRTRDGRPAYIVDFNENVAKFSQVRYLTPNVLQNTQRLSEFTVTRKGQFSPAGHPSHLDLFPVSPKAWNIQYEKGTVGIPAIQDRNSV